MIWGKEKGGHTGMTSRPMPSPGMRPMRRDRLAIKESYRRVMRLEKLYPVTSCFLRMVFAVFGR